MRTVRGGGKKLHDGEDWKRDSEELVVKGSSIWAYRSVMSGSWNLGR
ncbi:MAG: hypothetical protein QXQ46_11675 [Thermoplasmatales archaeon]